MKIFLTSIGTRGDIEPFIALGQKLEEEGHVVAYAFPEQLSFLVPATNNHYALSPKIIELIEGEHGQTVMGKAKPWKKIRALWYLYRQGQQANTTIAQQHLDAITLENPDLVICNPKCNFPTLWSLAFDRPQIILSPVPYVMHYVKGHAHIGFGNNLGTWIHKLSYRLSNFGLSETICKVAHSLPERFQYCRKEIHQRLLNSKMIYTVSPVLFPRPDDWPEHVQVVGFHKIQHPGQGSLRPEVQEFLDTHDKILFLTFGSMVNSHPDEVSEIIYAVLDSLQIPVIVNTASGGLVPLGAYTDHPLFLFTKYINYDAVLPKVYAIVHHGGSGTTHTALKYGLPSMIIPHLIDQFMWNRLLHDLGVGPLGRSINKLSGEKFKVAVLELMTRETYKNRALKIAEEMKVAEERWQDHLVSSIFDNP